jgi:hypothetical protein
MDDEKIKTDLFYLSRDTRHKHLHFTRTIMLRQIDILRTPPCAEQAEFFSNKEEKAVFKMIVYNKHEQPIHYFKSSDFSSKHPFGSVEFSKECSDSIMACIELSKQEDPDEQCVPAKIVLFFNRIGKEKTRNFEKVKACCERVRKMGLYKRVPIVVCGRQVNIYSVIVMANQVGDITGMYAPQGRYRME